MPRPEDQRSIRRYLLGELPAEEGERLEERLLTDEEFFQELLVGEDELIDLFLRGDLDAAEREHFTQHFLAAPERQQQLSFARALHKYVANAPPQAPTPARDTWAARLARWRRTLFTPRIALAFAAFAAVAVAFGVWRVYFYQSEVDKGLIALQTAYRAQRPTEVRITGFPYAQWTVVRGANEPQQIDQLAHDRAQSLLTNAAHEHADAPTLAALGRLYLAERNFEQARTQFEQALKLAPDDAELHGDLGATLLEQGMSERAGTDSGQSLNEFARALEHLTRALELNPTLLTARFNRALCYEQMARPQQAAEDWHKYLEQDANSQWATEAQQHLKQLEGRQGAQTHDSRQAN